MREMEREGGQGTRRSTKHDVSKVDFGGWLVGEVAMIPIPRASEHYPVSARPL